MPRAIQTNRCTNTVARSFGVEADITLRGAGELNDILREAGYTIEKIETTDPHNEETCKNKDEYGYPIEAGEHWQCRVYDDRKMKEVIKNWKPGENWVIYTPNHVQAIHADGTITDTAFNRRGFNNRTVNMAYKVS